MPKVQQPSPRPSFLTPDPCQFPGHEGTFWARGEGPTIGLYGFKPWSYCGPAVRVWEGAGPWTGLAPLMAH